MVIAARALILPLPSVSHTDKVVCFEDPCELKNLADFPFAITVQRSNGSKWLFGNILALKKLR